MSHNQQIYFTTIDHSMEVSRSNLAVSEAEHTEEFSPGDNLYTVVMSLVGKMQSFNKASDEADNAVDEIADILTNFNRDFIKLKSHERALVSDRVVGTGGVLSDFMSFADGLLPSKNYTYMWL